MSAWDPTLSVAGLGVGLVVGLTGMGGGALMTPVLVLLFGVPPLAAVSSDVVASFVMKPLGGLVHWRRGTVERALVARLCWGSVPGAFAGVLALRALGTAATLTTVVRFALGLALLVTAGALALRALVTARRSSAGAAPDGAPAPAGIRVRPALTTAIGAVGGLLVGMTSVGAGSLIGVCLLLTYPALRPAVLVGTDLVQAVPLVASASVGHLLFGDFRAGLTLAIVVGAVPGVWLGARASSRVPARAVRTALVAVMLASGAALLGAPPAVVGAVAAAPVVGGLGVEVVRRRRAGGGWA